VLASSGTVSTARPVAPDRQRAPTFAVFGFAAVYRVRLLDKPADLRLDFTNVGDARYVTRDASNLEGGWTIRGRGRAITVGIEQGF
jgi:outer membrane receptor protein involved in Fe transport